MSKPIRYSTLSVLLVASYANLASAQLIVAHRGASYDAPENTLAAFRLAWERKADAIEGDFYLTKDGEIVCIHDKTTKRVTAKKHDLNVAESTLAELRRIDVGSWKHPRFAAERIPTLAQVLATVPKGKQIFVEVKCGPEILPVLKRRLAESRLKADQITIICFNENVVLQARTMMSEYRANWLTSYKRSTPLSAWKPTSNDVLKSLRRTGATGLGTKGEQKVVDESFVRAVRTTGREFHVWTVNEAQPARFFKSLGVDSITTDRPAFIRKAILAERR